MKRKNYIIAILFFLIALIGFFPTISFDGEAVRMRDLINGLSELGIEDTLSYLSEFPDAIAGMAQTWLFCGILGIILPIVEGMLALLLLDKWVLLSSSLGLFANLAVKGMLVSDMRQINELMGTFGGEDLVAFAPGSLGTWITFHVAIAGLLIWQFVTIWREENLKVGYNGVCNMIDETVVQRKPVETGFKETQEEMRNEEMRIEKIGFEEKGAEKTMNQMIGLRELNPAEEAQRDDLFRRLGEEYYEIAQEDPLPQLLPLVDEIRALIVEPEPEEEMEKTTLWKPDESEKEIHKTEETGIVETEPETPLAPVRSDRIRCCPECGIYLPEGAKFCEECGHRIIEKTEPSEKPKPAFCPNCGNSLKDGIKFCGKCGTKIDF